MCFSLLSHFAKSNRVLTIVFISHLLATRKIKADQGTQTNEGGEIQDKKEILSHGPQQKHED